jgi:hypothetical protein
MGSKGMLTSSATQDMQQRTRQKQPLNAEQPLRHQASTALPLRAAPTKSRVQSALLLRKTFLLSVYPPSLARDCDLLTGKGRLEMRLALQCAQQVAAGTALQLRVTQTTLALAPPIPERLQQRVW